MCCQLAPCAIVLAGTLDGARGWSEFVRSAGRALASNQAFAPLLGLGVLVILIVFADWKLAGWIEHRWCRHHADHTEPGRESITDRRRQLDR